MEEAAVTPPAPAKTTGLVLRNAMFLAIAQVLVMPMSVLINAVMGRYLGPEEFGFLYVAWTFSSFGAVAVEWGQQGVLPSKITKERDRAGEILGSALAWRFVASLFTYVILAGICFALGYPYEVQVALALVSVAACISSAVSAFQDAVRGFERTDFTAKGMVGGQFLMALFVIPTLMLGGRMRATLLAQMISPVVVFFLMWRAIGSVGVGRLSIRTQTVKRLLVEGFPFLFFGLAMALQPYVDALFLSKLAPAEVVGWYAASRKLVGVLIFPASALITALYPTLCRLHVEDKESFRSTFGTALRVTTALVVPVAVGCAVYPEIGVSIFSKQSFGPAMDDLRVLSVFVLLVYFTMTLGVGLLAAGRQRVWAAIQFLCVAVSAVLDPILVPWFQAWKGNGGLGVCVAAVISEVVMVVAGIALMPRGVFDRALMRELVLALLSGGAMALVAHFLSWMTPFLAAPIAVAVYVGGLLVTGALDKNVTQTMREMVARKLGNKFGRKGA
jgi:O-antigen/teichoic acid export membrane protein